MTIPDYLQSPPISLWQFDYHHQAVEWVFEGSSRTSGTIALVAELAPLLRNLLGEFHGLPDFTAILFLLAASRKDSDPKTLSGFASIVFGTPIAQRSTAFFLHGFQA